MDALYQHWFKKTGRTKEKTEEQTQSARFSNHQQASKLNAFFKDNPNQIENSSKGYVSMVGAGPHDPELLTIKAVKAIMRADVLLYDRLVNKDILELASSASDWIYVGKRCGETSIKQSEISHLMVQLAQQGKRVVRLKGGDAFVFGRGGEEALELVRHSIPYEVIPGITAAIGCSASSLIPLTHRGISRSVTFVTGQVVTGAFDAWSQLMKSGQTLVFYMGLEKSSEIQKGLITSGLPDDFPVAIISHGCSPQQQIRITQLNQLKELSKTLKGISPTLIVMGEVVKLREQLINTVQSVTEYEVT
ncbi:uroporphyrinogen-III C-methyltransferase [Vibrio sinensis]|uniref:uroporphyrinogen-III C-methyltransferase n=1 Tax=Vibrio sinensis TaxID=2302434 RepID=A0A3A6QLH6_9VIBR|nr:uroporphyrinogen-III C-methyltransferase [Vibrio sinensis]RJX71443.1 uroporphyrinogen-III C-methyltransferase [Vibrio sinensis]